LFGQNFYFSLIRKYVILVGTLVNDIVIIKTDKSGNQTGIIKVPVTYAPKDKMLARVLQDPDISRQTATPTLPLISFEMGQIRYDGTRKLNTVGKISIKKDSNTFKYQYNPVPYNFEFKVYIYVKNTEDGTKIIEQILPYFTPDWTTTVKLIPEVEEIKDIPVILNDVKYEDTYDKDFKERRAIIWTLDLTLKGYLYGPVKSSGIIKFVKTNFYIPNVPDGQLQNAVGNTSISEKISIQPGLTVNGTPTSNISLTIPYQEIEVSDDYGFIDIITPNDDLI
jgi:T4-like virus Myoviridae tail sheath stabiliser